MQNTNLTGTADKLSGCMPFIRSIRVLVDHQDPLLAAGMEVTLCQAADGFEVVRREREPLAPKSSRMSDPSVVLVADYDTGVRHATDTSRRGAILIVTQFDDAARIRLAVHHGIRGYLLQGCGTEDLIQGILALHRGATAFAPIVAARIAESSGNDPLTDRQLTVLRYLMLGFCTKEICRHMAIADGTVKAHVRAIFAKLGANKRAEAVAIARRRGLVLEPVMSDLRGEWSRGAVPHSATRLTDTSY